jgi:hypothetical protein
MVNSVQRQKEGTTQPAARQLLSFQASRDHPQISMFLMVSPISPAHMVQRVIWSIGLQIYPIFPPNVDPRQPAPKILLWLRNIIDYSTQDFCNQSTSFHVRILLANESTIF